MRKLGIALAMGLAAACSQQAEDGVDKAAGSGATLYIAQAILTLENDDPKGRCCDGAQWIDRRSRR